RLLTSGETKRIIACSNLVKNQIVQHYGVEPGRIAVIPNGVAFQEKNGPESMRTSLRKRWGIPGDDRVLLFVGNEFARKGLQTVLEAMARLAMPDVRLLVVGAGNIGPYERLTEALHLGGRVSFLGSVERPERLFGIADIFIFPTLYDPCPLVVLEAMAAGVPVVTSRSCGTVEGMTHGLHGIYLDDPTSAGEAAEWIRTLLTDHKLHEQLSLEGRNKAREYCWDAIAARTLEILEKVVPEKQNA
ncbi:glycosyltransferase family 1 protein, partial [bacterium]